MQNYYYTWWKYNYVAYCSSQDQYLPPIQFIGRLCSTVAVILPLSQSITARNLWCRQRAERPTLLQWHLAMTRSIRHLLFPKVQTLNLQPVWWYPSTEYMCALIGAALSLHRRAKLRQTPNFLKSERKTAPLLSYPDRLEHRITLKKSGYGLSFTYSPEVAPVVP